MLIIRSAYVYGSAMNDKGSEGENHRSLTSILLFRCWLHDPWSQVA